MAVLIIAIDSTGQLIIERKVLKAVVYKSIAKYSEDVDIHG